MKKKLDLIKKLKEQNNKRKFTYCYNMDEDKLVFSFDCSNTDRILEVLSENREQGMNEYQNCIELLYLCCSELSNNDLLESYSCKDNPTKIVTEIFTFGEIMEIGQKITDLVTYTRGEFDNAKN